MVYKAALIGCGKIGSEYADSVLEEGVYSHAQAYSVCPDTELVAICDSDPAALEKCGERWKVNRRYRDGLRMLENEQPDIVSVCTSDESHPSIINMAITAEGTRAVLAEKPLASQLGAANELVRLAAERGVVLAVNYSRRFDENHIWLKEYLDAGGIGEIQTVGGYYYKGLVHNGTHWLDLARYFFGEVASVWGANVMRDDEIDPTLDAILEFESGVSAHLQGCDYRAYSLSEMDLIGTRGRVRLVESGNQFEIYELTESRQYKGEMTLIKTKTVTGGLQKALLHALENLIDCLESGQQPRCSGSDAIASLKIATAIQESARLGRRVELRNDPNE